MDKDSRGRGHYYTLEPTGRREVEFRLARSSYEDLVQSPAMLTALRNAQEIAGSHTMATRGEILVYFEQVMALRKAKAAAEREKEELVEN